MSLRPLRGPFEIADGEEFAIRWMVGGGSPEISPRAVGMEVGPENQ